MGENFEIKVSDVEECKIDYSKTVEDLVAFYDEQAQKISEGDKSFLNGEFMMLGYAIDFIGLIQQIAHVTLGFDEGVIPTLDNLLISLEKHFQQQPVSEDFFNDIVKKATGFLSVVIWKNIGGGFISSNLGYGVNVKGTNAFLYNRVGRRLQGAADSDLISIYEMLKNL